MADAAATDTERAGLLGRFRRRPSAPAPSCEDQARAELEAVLGASPGPRPPVVEDPPVPTSAVVGAEPVAAPEALPLDAPPLPDEGALAFPGMFGRRPTALAKPHFEEFELER